MPTAARSIKRKPIPTSPAADFASRTLLRPPLARGADDHSGSSSSGLVLSSLSSYKSSSSGGYHASYHNSSGEDDDGTFEQNHSQEPQPQPQPHPPTTTNPFTNNGGYAYLEDYGPEYSHDGYNNYSDGDDGAYGGHVSLDRYEDPTSPRGGAGNSNRWDRGSTSAGASGKTEWPLRNIMGGGSASKKRTRSPMWDRVYERV